MIRARASTILAFLLTTLAATADPSLASLLPGPLLERLRAGEEVTHTLGDGQGPELVPAIPEAGDLTREMEALDSTVGVEVLRLYTAREQDFDSDEARLALYNILRSVSSMQGIEYYSATRGRMRTLFASSYAVAGPQSKAPIPDPLVAEVPPYSLAYMFQEDLTFGKNLYRAEYLAGRYGVILKSRNLTEMWYYFLPMVKPENSLTILMVLPYGRDILFYGAMTAHTPSLFGIERSREESFYNRLNALYGWFVREVSRRSGG